MITLSGFCCVTFTVWKIDMILFPFRFLRFLYRQLNNWCPELGFARTGVRSITTSTRARSRTQSLPTRSSTRTTSISSSTTATVETSISRMFDFCRPIILLSVSHKIDDGNVHKWRHGFRTKFIMPVYLLSASWNIDFGSFLSGKSVEVVESRNPTN